MKQTTPPPVKGLDVHMLGGFSVSADDKLIVSTDAGGQIWNLMEYLVCFRDKPYSQEQLLEALWDDDVEDPAAALKNLVYRLRKAFTDAGISWARELVSSKGGVYHWNTALPMRVDTQQFEEAAHRAETEKNPAARLKLLCTAAELYSGEFLPGACSRIWVTPINRYYHALYFNVVYTLLDACERDKNWELMYACAHRAAEIDPFEEDVHYYILLSLARLGRQNEAIRHYNYVSDLFYRELGADLSPRLGDMFTEIAKSAKNGNENLATLKAELREEEDVRGAYYCEYEIFKSLYHIKARSVERDGDSVFLGLLTIAGFTPGADPEPSVRNQAMQALHRAVVESLRVGDVFSRCTGTQYVILLSHINFENGEMVMSRIVRRFKSFAAAGKVALTYSLQAVDPATL